MREFGVIKSVIINGENGILTAGHQRTRAMKVIGITHFLAIRLQDVTRIDEIRFNPFHNSIETNKTPVTLNLEGSELEVENYCYIEPERIQFKRNANALNINGMSRLIMRYGGWGNVVMSPLKRAR